MVTSGVLADGWRGSLTVNDLESLRPIVKATALRVTGSESLAEDVAQESLARAASALQGGVVVTNPRAWMRRIVVHASLDALKAHESSSLEDRAELAEPCHNSRGLDVRDALSRLSPDHQVVLALAFGEGLSHKEISEALDVPMGTVASRIHAAKAAFRKEWGDENV